MSSDRERQERYERARRVMAALMPDLVGLHERTTEDAVLAYVVVVRREGDGLGLRQVLLDEGPTDDGDDVLMRAHAVDLIALIMLKTLAWLTESRMQNEGVNVNVGLRGAGTEH